jgi:CO/xanthine dehydrogenase Mo-binding subunit
VAVFTAKDVPVNEYGQIFQDQPVLCGPGSSKEYADRVRFVGDQVALVVRRERERLQRQLARRSLLTYEDLPVVTDVHQAMDADAALLHPDKLDRTL